MIKILKRPPNTIFIWDIFMRSLCYCRKIQVKRVGDNASAIY